MTGVGFILLSGAVLMVSALASLLAWRHGRVATLISTAGALAGCSLGLWASLAALITGFNSEVSVAWHVPYGMLAFGVDPLSAFFLVPLFLLGALTAVYGRSYLGGRGSARPLALPAASFNALLASMVCVLIARHAVVLLVAWEVMTLLSYLLVTFEHAQAEVRRAGWTYLIASHVAMAALIALFLTLGVRAAGALDFASFAAARATSLGTLVGLFVLALVGFGVKAGIVPLHVWLPEAHSAAPSHVSALMSGVLIKLGVYGLLRTALFLPPVAWIGTVLMTFGLLGAVVGISLALYQRDLKRVLAYSSIENMGVVLLGLGLGLWARARGYHDLAALGFAGGLLHVWNHALMKGLMFLGAGSALHGAGSKDIERLGGLARRMPWTGATLIIGAVAIAGLPPLNGFTGEWLIYRGLTNAGLQGGIRAFAAVGVLALVGGLAALCFVRLIGVVLLGQPRSDGARGAHESPRAMIAPMVALAAICVLVAILPGWVVSAQSSLLALLLPSVRAPIVAPVASLGTLSICNVALMVAAGIVALLLDRRTRAAAADDTWGCGYAAPSSRMQYTGRSFSEMMAERLLPRVLRARLRVDASPSLFPGKAKLSSNSDDPLTRDVFEPLFKRWGDRFARLRWLQHGRLHLYLVYVVAVTVLALAWSTLRDWLRP